jgi:hypothetical protein
VTIPSNRSASSRSVVARRSLRLTSILEESTTSFTQCLRPQMPMQPELLAARLVTTELVARSGKSKQLRDFRDGRRTKDAGVMHQIAQSLTDADIDELGNYFASVR